MESGFYLFFWFNYLYTTNVSHEVHTEKHYAIMQSILIQQV